MEKAGGADVDVGDIGVAFGSLEVPTTPSKPRRDNLLVEVNVFGKAAVTRDLLDIGPDLAAGAYLRDQS